MPKVLDDLAEQLNLLPGISRKQAERLAYHFALLDSPDRVRLINAFEGVKSLRKCTQCFNVADGKLCQICQDQNRQRILVVVASPLDIIKFEALQKMRPYYHVLGGLMNVSGSVKFENLNTENLIERARSYGEVILALSSNLEGIVTASVISKILGAVKGLQITQLAQGIPLGAAMDYVDELTLKAALDNRKELKK